MPWCVTWAIGFRIQVNRIVVLNSSEVLLLVLHCLAEKDVKFLILKVLADESRVCLSMPPMAIFPVQLSVKSLTY